jgi:hypothetical protein
LRETNNCLKIVHRTKLYGAEEPILLAKQECRELLAIFVASVNTAKKNIDKK